MKASLYTNPDPKPHRERARAEAMAQLQGFLEQATGWRARAALRRAIHWIGYAELGHRKRTGPAKANRDKKATARKNAQNSASVKTAGNRWQRWTGAHDELVMTSTKTDVELGQQIGRTVKAIRVRRVVLKNGGWPA